MEPLRRIGSFPNTTYEAVYATATPGAEKFDSKWFDSWYEGEGGREYLMYDPRNEDDRMKIADWNGWGQTWKDFLQRVKDCGKCAKWVTSDWIYYLALHFARHGSEKNVYCGVQEGMHRSVGLIQAALNAHLNVLTGSINPNDQPMSVTVMTNCKVMGPDANVDDSNITDAVAKMNSDPSQDRHKTNRMVNAKLTAKAHWITNHKANVPKVMSALRFISQAISNEKRTSSHRSAAFFIADDIYAYLTRINAQSIGSIPEFKEECPAHLRTTAKKFINDQNVDFSNEEEKFQACSLLTDECMKKYIDDPFNENHIKDVETLLSRKPMARPKADDKEDEAEEVPTTRMKPPYYIDYSVLVSSPSKNNNMSAEIANAYYLVPRIMHYLYAGKYNKVMKSTAGDVYLNELITYTLKYHCGGDMGEPSSYGIHPAIQLYRSLNNESKNKKTCGDAGVDPIGATLAVIFMVNAAIAQSGQYTNDKTKIVEKINANASLLRNVFYIIDSKKEAVSLMAHLGKLFFCDLLLCLFSTSLI